MLSVLHSLGTTKRHIFAVTISGPPARFVCLTDSKSVKGNLRILGLPFSKSDRPVNVVIEDLALQERVTSHADSWSVTASIA